MSGRGQIQGYEGPKRVKNRPKIVFLNSIQDHFPMVGGASGALWDPQTCTLGVPMLVYASGNPGWGGGGRGGENR